MRLARYLTARVAVAAGWAAFAGVTWLYGRLYPARSGQSSQLFDVPVEGVAYAAVAFLLVTGAVMLAGMAVTG